MHYSKSSRFLQEHFEKKRSLQEILKFEPTVTLISDSGRNFGKRATITPQNFFFFGKILKILKIFVKNPLVALAINST